MVFSAPHVYWTFIWDVNGSASESGQIGIRASTPGTPPTLSTVEAVGDAFGAFWVHTDSRIPSKFEFRTVKAALINVDGRYDPDFDPVVDNRSAVAGAGTAVIYPLQVAHSLQLTTDRLSGRAHAGRVFLPPISNVLDSGFSWGTTLVNARVARFAVFLAAMNAAMPGESAQVMSSIGAGTTREITGVRGDTRPDVQRRRARQQPYSWGAVSPV